MTPNDLAAAVEGAEGPSRELDGEIFKTACEKPGDIWHCFEQDGLWCRQCPDDAVAWDVPPAYTASIDAAMSLVPEGWVVEAKRGFTDDDDYWCAVTLTNSFSGGRDGGDLVAVDSLGLRDLPLALCAAALRARAIEGEGE